MEEFLISHIYNFIWVLVTDCLIILTIIGWGTGVGWFLIYFGFFCVGSDLVMRGHIMEWIFGLRPCHNPKWLKSQHRVIHTNLWWCCILLTGMSWGGGCAIFYHTSRQNLQPLVWKWWGGCHVSIVLGLFLSDGIHMVQGFVLGHHIQSSLTVSVHTFPW